MKSLFTPADSRQMVRKYQAKEGDGPCGPACLAVIERRPIMFVLDDWKELFGEYRGWARWKELRQYLEHKGWKVKQCRFRGHIDPTSEKFVLCRVQWVGPHPDKPEFACWRHWTEAAAHTHFIVVEDHDFFCSVEGWSSLSKLNDYLVGPIEMACGVVTSYMEVWRE